MAGKIVRRLVVEIDEEHEVSIDGYGWANVDTEDGSRALWLGGDIPTMVILARQDEVSAPQVVANEVWHLDRLQAVLHQTSHLADEVAGGDRECTCDDEDDEP